MYANYSITLISFIILYLCKPFVFGETYNKFVMANKECICFTFDSRAMFGNKFFSSYKIIKEFP